MPIYEYECSYCNIKTTVSRSISENDPGYSCESCNLKLNRVYSSSGFGITFKGSGFYSKDK